MMMALSGKGEVLKDKIPRDCLFVASSPKLIVVAELFIEPPILLISDDSSIEPSCVALETKVSVCKDFVAVFVSVAVAVFVTVFVRVNVIDGVLVSVGVRVAVLVGVKVGV